VLTTLKPLSMLRKLRRVCHESLNPVSLPSSFIQSQLRATKDQVSCSTPTLRHIQIEEQHCFSSVNCLCVLRGVFRIDQGLLLDNKAPSSLAGDDGVFNNTTSAAFADIRWWIASAAKILTHQRPQTQPSWRFSSLMCLPLFLYLPEYSTVTVHVLCVPYVFAWSLT
jgi:hypothetical protein